jgi:hypothetical protein
LINQPRLKEKCSNVKEKKKQDLASLTKMDYVIGEKKNYCNVQSTTVNTCFALKK